MSTEVEPALWNAAAMLSPPGSMAAGLQRLKVCALRYSENGGRMQTWKEAGNHETFSANPSEYRPRPVGAGARAGGGWGMVCAPPLAPDRRPTVRRGARATGAGDSRQVGRAAYLRTKRSRPVLRPGLHACAGPVVANGDEPTRRQRHPERVPGPGDARQ